MFRLSISLGRFGKKNPSDFSIDYSRESINRKISSETEASILSELSIEKSLIEDSTNPIKKYNYSYVKDTLASDHDFKVSLPTIIDRAKKYGFYDKKKAKKAHDREVLTNYAGELLQHDITTLDDYSRKILYGNFIEAEQAGQHRSYRIYLPKIWYSIFLLC